MKFYIGYFNKPWNKSEFTVICATPSKHAALFIIEQYKKAARESNMSDGYELLTAAEIMDKKLIFND